MKIKNKIILTIIVTFLFAIISNVAYGASCTGNIKANTTTIKENEEIEISFYLKDCKDLEKGINAYKATIEYDKNIFEELNINSFESKNSWEQLQYNNDTNEFVAIKKVGTTADEEVVSIKLKVKNEIKGENTSIVIKNIVASEGKEDINIDEKQLILDIDTNKDENQDGEQGNTGENQDDNQGGNQGSTGNSQVGGNTENNSSGHIVGGNSSNNTSVGKLPQTGIGSEAWFILIAIEILVVIAVISFIKIRKVDSKISKNKKMFISILCFGIITAQLATNIYAATTKGELNDDGKVDYEDIVLLEKHLIHLSTLPDNKLNAADINSDGKITVTDLSLLVQQVKNNYNYTVNITKSDENYVVNKNSEVEYKFIADVTYGTEITSVTINGNEYPVTKLSDNEYAVKLKVSDKAGIQEFKFTNAKLNVGKDVDVDFTAQIDVLKDAPKVENFDASISKGEITITFDFIDNDKAVTSSTFIVKDEKGTELLRKENIEATSQAIKFALNDYDKYSVILLADYKLDTSTSGSSENEYKNQELVNKTLTLTQEVIEFKDIKNVALYKKENDQVVEVKEINVNEFNVNDYLVEVAMNNLPKLYSEIREARVEDGKLLLELKYDNVIQYNDGKRDYKLEVPFGDVDEDNIAKKTNNTTAKNEEQSENKGLYIPDLSRLKNMPEYNEAKEIAYHNMNILIPFLDAKYIVYYGNEIASDDILNQDKIKMIIPYDADGNMVIGLNTNNYEAISKLKLIFESEQTIDYDVSFAQKINDIAIYNFNNLKIKYNYPKYVLNRKITTVDSIIDKAKNLDYKEQIAKVTSEEESRLYVDYYNESVKNKLEDVILGILENSEDYNLYLDNEILKTKVEQELNSNLQLEKILYTYNYIDKWYHEEIGNVPLTNMVFFKIKEVNNGQDIKALVDLTMKQSENVRKTNSTVNFFNNVIKSQLGNKDIGQFIEYYIKVLANYNDADKWFADNFGGILVEKPALGNENIRYKAWELIKSRNHLILPILSAPQEDMYIVSVPSQLIIGSLNRYSQHLNGDEEGMKNTIDSYATKISNFYGISASFIKNAESILNSHAHIQYDTRFNFPEIGTQEQGTTEDPVLKWLYEAIGSFATANGSAAYANGTDVYWVLNHAIGSGSTSDYTFSVFTHETAHNQDGYYFYEGNGRRKNTWAEDHADSNIAQDIDDGSVVFNLRGDISKASDVSNNLSLERITGTENIYTYYKEMFETYYVLDYLTGQAFLQLTPEEQSKLAVQVSYNNGTNYEEGGQNTTYSKITEEEFTAMNLKTMEDLWDNGITLRDAGTVSGASPGAYGGDKHYSIYWYQPHNNSGRPDSHTFKRLGFEMLGVGGYSNGYVTYRSGKSSSDLDALRKITGDGNITWKQYKMDRYENVEQNLSKIPYFNAQEVIEAYKEALEKDAKAGNRNNTNNLRRILYGVVKRATKDFTTGTIYGINEETKISSAQQLIQVLSTEEWGNYVLTNDLDFSKITTEDSTYITNPFIGRLNGNGYSIKGLTKPLFTEMDYAEVQNLTIQEPVYNEDVNSILTVKSKNILLNDAVVKDANINLPFVQTSSGSIQWLGKTEINVKKQEINTIEDIKNIDNNAISGKSDYTLNADIDLSSITEGDSIITGNFSGTLDGNGHTLYNLNMPLFNNLTGTAKNLTIKNMNYNSSGASMVGALAKTANNATGENIKIEDVTINGKENLAGLVGVSKGSNFNKIAIKNVNITGSRFYIGGIIGRATNTSLVNAKVTGKLTIHATHNGGVIGAINGGKMENVYCNVTIERPSNTDNRNQNGGLIGSIEGGNPSIRNSINIGNVAENVYKAIGGIDGKTAGQLTNKKDCIYNIFESSDATGISNLTEENNIQAVNSSTYMQKEFYMQNLGWSEEIWDFNNETTEPEIK